MAWAGQSRMRLIRRQRRSCCSVATAAAAAAGAAACSAGLSFAVARRLPAPLEATLQGGQRKSAVAARQRWRQRVRRHAFDDFVYEAAAQAGQEVQLGLASGGLSPVVLLLAGVASSVNPCNMAVLPSAVTAVAAASNGGGRGSAFTQALAFMLGSGVVLSMVGLGASFIGAQLLQQASPVQWLFPCIAVAMGLSLLRLIPFEIKLPGLDGGGEWVNSVPQEWKGFCLGAASAASTSTCSTPVLVTIISYISANAVGPASAAGLFFLYAIGYCVPLAAVSSFAAALPWLQAGSQYGPLLAGSAILAVGISQLLGQVATILDVDSFLLLSSALIASSAAVALASWPKQRTVMQATPITGEMGLYRYTPTAVAGLGSPPEFKQREAEVMSRSEGRLAAGLAVLAAVASSLPEAPQEADKRSNNAASTSSAVPAASDFGNMSLQERRSTLKELAAQSPPLGAALRAGKPVVVDFSALWCPDCLKVAPVLKEMEETYRKEVTFVTLDISYGHPEPSFAATFPPPTRESLWWTQQFGVSAIPHIAFVDATGRVLTAFVGAPPRRIFEEQIDALSQRQPLPYIMYDAFQEGRRKLAWPPDSSAASQ